MVNSKDDSHFLISHILKLKKQNSGHLGENAPFDTPVYYSAAVRIGLILSRCVHSTKFPFAYTKLRRNYSSLSIKTPRYSFTATGRLWLMKGRKLDDIKRKVSLKSNKNCNRDSG
jgi:hypothetical protein